MGARSGRYSSAANVRPRTGTASSTMVPRLYTVGVGDEAVAEKFSDRVAGTSVSVGSGDAELVTVTSADADGCSRGEALSVREGVRTRDPVGVAVCDAVGSTDTVRGTRVTVAVYGRNVAVADPVALLLGGGGGEDVLVAGREAL